MTSLGSDQPENLMKYINPLQDTAFQCSPTTEILYSQHGQDTHLHDL